VINFCIPCSCNAIGEEVTMSLEMQA